MSDSPNLENELNAASSRIDVGSADDMLVSVHATANKRRRRRNVVMGVAAAGTLVVSGVAIANVASNGGDDDLLISSPATDPVDDSATDTTEPVDETPPTTVAAIPVPDPAATGGTPIEVAAVPANGTVVNDAVSGAQQAVNAKVLPWKGGFLAVTQQFQPQPLPTELPDEITEQFSQEVVDLFAEGLPATIDEAIQMLNEADLYDEVSDIVVNNPDVYDAIYGAPSQAPQISARYSADGIEWDDIDLVVPDDGFQIWNMASTGDRVVTVLEPTPSPDGSHSNPTSIDVVWSDDLINWTTQSFAAPQPPADTPDYVEFFTHPSQLVAAPGGWVLSVNTHSNVDVWSLIDPDLRDEIQNSSDGYGYGTDENGIEINVGGPRNGGGDDEGRTIRFTWEELGVEGFDGNFEESSSLVVSSDWVGEPVVSDASPDGGHQQIMALDNGFAAASFDQGVRLSTDGVNWETIAVPGINYVESIMPVGDTVVAFGSSDSGERLQFLLDRATNTWTPLDIAGLPEQFSSGSVSNGVTMLYEFEEGYGSASFPSGGSRMLAEADGYGFELQVTYGEASVTGSYTLTDLATGTVVSTETLELTGIESDEDFEFAKEVYDIDGGEEGFRLLDPATGDELVAFAFEDMTFQELDADGNVIATDQFDNGDAPVVTTVTEEGSSDEPEFVEPDFEQPQQWLLASDGETWLLEQLDGADEFGGYGEAVMVDGVVLVSSYDGSFLRYELG